MLDVETTADAAGSVSMQTIARSRSTASSAASTDLGKNSHYEFTVIHIEVLLSLLRFMLGQWMTGSREQCL